MRIATSQLYDRPMSLMSSLTQQADTLQTQIATGSRITRASDDSAAWRQLDTLKRADADDAAYAANVKLAQGLVAQADTALDSVTTRLQRAQELAVQAANGTMSASDRTAIGTELAGILDDLLSIANSKDVRGQPIFGGANGEAYAQASDGTISYTGSGEPSAVPLGANASVATGVTGDRAFGDMFATLQAIAAAVAAGDTPSGNDVDALQSSLDQVAAARASIGARGARLDLESTRLSDAAIAREDSRTAIDSTDISATITELQKTLTILQATQASFTKLSNLSLFDYLR